MQINLYKISVPRFVNALRNLEGMLIVAEKHANKSDINQAYFSHLKLYQDMMPLYKQVKLACDNCIRWTLLVKEDNTDAGLINIPFTDPEEPGIAIPYLRNRVRKNISFFEWLSYDDIDRIVGRSTKIITITNHDGSLYSMSALDMLTNHVLPNLYFHCTTTYNILRHNGVELGKINYVSSYPWEATPI